MLEQGGNTEVQRKYRSVRCGDWTESKFSGGEMAEAERRDTWCNDEEEDKNKEKRIKIQRQTQNARLS